MLHLIEAFDEALVRRIQLVLDGAGISWLLEEQQVVDILCQVDGDLGQFALELNDQADMLALAWLPPRLGRTIQDHDRCRDWARALKTASVAIEHAYNPTRS